MSVSVRLRMFVNVCVCVGVCKRVLLFVNVCVGGWVAGCMYVSGGWVVGG